PSYARYDNPTTGALEELMKELESGQDAFACSSGMMALHLALLAAGVRSGDEVVTVSHSFIATANSVRHCGATPVFVDIAPDTYNIDPARVAAAIVPRTRAILCVHQMGMPCDVRALAEVASACGLPLVEDAACAVGSEIAVNGEWERIGRPHGDVACFSFHPRKLITTGDGGMVTTRDETIDARIRAWRSHGTRDGVYGFNYRMTDVQAAIGRVQLRRLPALVAERRAIVDRLRARISRVEFPVEPSWARSNWQSLCVRLPSADAARAAMARLEAAGIAVRTGIANAHEAAEQRDGLRGPLPESERAHRECLLLPLPSNMTDDEIDRLVAALS
ncbi:MAG TPA: DegT/DnrJ/EryC1/StrS family aminotransferase, partial [Polyangia bacterium]|nr:DegT/DnrJ/EryC1/StrS family aminotransferase [Polyangia bacterium]